MCWVELVSAAAGLFSSGGSSAPAPVQKKAPEIPAPRASTESEAPGGEASAEAKKKRKGVMSTWLTKDTGLGSMDSSSSGKSSVLGRL